MVGDELTSRTSFWGHVGALRNYVLIAAGFFTVIAAFCFAYADNVLIDFLLRPLGGEELLFLSPLGPFLFRLKVALDAALIGSFPVWLLLLGRFIAPALTRRERFVFTLYAAAALILAALSLGVGFHYLLPMTLAALRGFSVSGTQTFLTADSYFSFVLMELVLVFVVLQVPIALVALARVGMLNPYTLARYRRFAILAIVLVLAILTPTTDALTLIVVSIPTILLWEGGVAIAKLVYTRTQ